jgi:hypothetical protein
MVKWHPRKRNRARLPPDSAEFSKKKGVKDEKGAWD